MARFLLARFFQAIVSFLVVSVIVFALIRMAGDPVDILLDIGSTQEMRDHLIQELGLDRSYPEQFLSFLVQMLSGNFGVSSTNGAPVMQLMGDAFLNTVILSVSAMLVALVIAVPIGVYSAVYRDSRFDKVVRMFAIFGQSAPAFVIAIGLIMIFSLWLDWLPTSGNRGPQYLILPSVTLGWYIAAGIMRMTRTSMLEVLRTDYVRLARAKGVPDFIVIWKHALKNAALPVTTFAAILFVGLLSGSVVTETVFSWPGVGRLLVQSVARRDYPLVQAIVIVFSVLYLVINLGVDLVYVYLNPRIRFGKS